MIVALLALLAQAAAPAPSEGERLFRRCTACHALEPGRHSPAGPSLHNIVGGPVAGQAGFRYSGALQAYARRHPRWMEAELDRFIADPLAAIPGTHMSFPGIENPRERRALIRWLARPGARSD